MDLKDMFFVFTRTVKIQGQEDVTSTGGFAWNRVERFYTDDRGFVVVDLISQSEGYQVQQVVEKNKIIPRSIKTQINNSLVIEHKVDVERFLRLVDNRINDTN